jgi:hypothetical protein
VKCECCSYLESVKDKDVNDAVLTTMLTVIKKRFDEITQRF